jgi:hypothetical protein
MFRACPLFACVKRIYYQVLIRNLLEYGVLSGCHFQVADLVRIAIQLKIRTQAQYIFVMITCDSRAPIKTRFEFDLKFHPENIKLKLSPTNDGRRTTENLCSSSINGTTPGVSHLMLNFLKTMNRNVGCVFVHSTSSGVL